MYAAEDAFRKRLVQRGVVELQRRPTFYETIVVKERMARGVDWYGHRPVTLRIDAEEEADLGAMQTIRFGRAGSR